MEITAPAKINLYLNVLYKRPDGYHEIETLFERISLADRLSVELTGGQTSITCDNPMVPTDPGSLMMRVIGLFNAKSGARHRFRVHLEKKIPVSAGLGGGSSDAASLLMAMNITAGNPLGMDCLSEIAASCGSDIPFFLQDTSFAVGRGRGESLRKVKSGLKIWHILINPPFEVSTKDIYDGLDPLVLTRKVAVDTMFSTFLRDKDYSGIAKNLCNDLQDVTLGKFPVLGKVFSALRESGAEGVLLSGSGPTVFGIFSEEKVFAARDTLSSVFPEKEGWRVFAACTV
jgi:4-diphosphocytidyl-2-C-methyl-D-erythritol kinase